MGMFDTVRIRCQHCGHISEEQTKARDLPQCETFDAGKDPMPPEIAFELQADGVECESCHQRTFVEVVGVPALVGTKLVAAPPSKETVHAMMQRIGQASPVPDVARIGRLLAEATKDLPVAERIARVTISVDDAGMTRTDVVTRGGGDYELLIAKDRGEAVGVLRRRMTVGGDG